MFYHIQIHHKNSADEYKINLTEEELIERFVRPYESGIPIVVNGTTIKLDLINRIKIFETDDNLDSVVEAFENRRKADRNPYKIFDVAPEWRAIETGKDVTDKYITGPAGHRKGEPVAKVVEKRLAKVSERISGKEKIFVVHGHDNALKDETCVFLSDIGFDPIVLHRQPDGGLTIIEKFEKYSNVNYAVVLLTPDDYGMKAEELKKAEGERQGEFRARQNVIFELGFFIGRLGRQSVCCLFKNVEVPSDINGLIYKTVNKSVDEIGYEIIKELKAAGLHPRLE